MKFVNAIRTANFVVTIAAASEGLVNVSFKAITDDAKVYTKAKKLSKKDLVTLPQGEVIARIETLENGVSALTAILKA